MSVLIKGIEMPKRGIYVLTVGNNGADETVFTIATQTNSGKIIPCYSGVAISIPPHGQLKDADALLQKQHGMVVMALDIIEAPTIIEAEEVADE